MTLRDLVDRYVAWQRDHGAKFHSSSRTLDAYCRQVGQDRGCDTVSEDEIRRFLAGKGVLTRTRAVKYGTLAGLYRYALSRDHVSQIPMPPREAEPRSPEVAPSFIFTHEELRRLFEAAGHRSSRRCPKLDSKTFRSFLILLYGAGLRSGEARRLTMADVDLNAAVLTVNDSKFYKSRLVPIGTDLVDVLRRYAVVRADHPLREGLRSPFLACRDGSPLKKAMVRNAFQATLRVAGISNKPGCRAPCLHSLRHSFATNRLTSWHREGADVQRLLPALSTYLGHSSLAATQIYISMTPDLLDEAGHRFEQYIEQYRNPDAGQCRKGGTTND